MANRVDQGSKKTSPARRSTPPPVERSISPTPRLPARNRFFSLSRRRTTILGIVFIGLAASLLFWIHPSQLLHAATYTWAQNAWTGGVTANTGVHPTNQTGWTEYAAKDATIVAGASVALIPASQTITKTSDTDFSGGTFSGTAVSGSGVGSSVAITNSVIDPPVKYSYPTNRNFLDTAYDNDNHVVWASTGSAAQQLIRFPTDGGAETVINIPAISGVIFSGIEYDPTRHTLWASGTGGHLYEINPNYPSTPTIAHDYTASVLGEISLDTVNQYVYITDGWKLRRIKMDGTGAKNCFYDSAGYTEVHSVIVNAAGTYVYFTLWDAEGGVGIRVERWDAATCTTTMTSGADNVSLGTRLAFDGAGNIWSTSSSGLYKINPTSITATQYQSGSLYQGLVYDANQNVLWSVKTGNSLVRVSAVNGSLVGSSVASTAPYGSMVMVPENQTVWYGNGTTEARISTVGYPTSGTFTSAPIDTGGNVVLDTVTFTTTTPTNTTLTIKVRSSSQSNMTGATDWGSCAAITSGQAMSTGNCVTNGHRYLQYLATLGTTDTTKSPSLDAIDLTYTIYTNGTLTSSSFDAVDATNVLAKLQWTASGTGTVKFQLRTSPDNATWTSWLGPTGAGDYYTDPAGNTSVNPTNHDGTGDRYMQYKAFLISTDSTSTPTLSSVTTTYVVNAPPEFQAAPVAAQNSDGTVTISYSVRDSDTSSDTGSVGLVTPSFEYSTNNGSTWSAITSGLPGSATTAKTVDGTSYTSYSTTWTAKSQINGTYATQAKIRVTISDQQAANATAQGVSSVFVLDVKNPTLGSPAIAVNGSVTNDNITLNASDDSSLEMCVSLDNTLTSCQPYASTKTLALVTNPDTVYVTYRDAFGNTASASAVSPETPQNLIIRDLSNLEANQYFLFVSWRSVSTSLSEFGSYQIWHSTDGNSYTLLQTIADRSINYFLHQGLTDGSTHYYKVVSTDTHGNISVFSSVVSDTVNGQGGTDATPPTISHIVHTTTTQTATITWDTDELANSTIGYSTTPGVFTTEAGLATMADTATGVGHHEIIIGGLTPNTAYYYRVQSSDPSGNTATSDNGGDGFAFTTTAGPSISNVTTPSIENTSAQITWQTNVPAPSKVTYSTSASLTNPSSVETVDEVTNHSLTLTNLAIGTRYYFQVQSGTGIDTNHGTFYSFVTTADTIAPVISNFSVVLVTDTQALLRWETNERATSRASFGTQSGAYTQSTAADSVLNLTHSVTLNNLSPKTDYFLTVQSADAAGNSVTSSELKFSTSEQLLTDTEVQKLLDELRTSSDTVAPIISDVTVTSNDPHSAQASWSTNEAANSFLELTPAAGETEVIGDWVYLTNHTLTTPTLSPATSYSYRVISADKSGNISTSSTATFTTPALTVTELATELEQQAQQLESAGANLPAPVIGGQPRVDVAATSATVSWTTNTPTDGQVAIASSSYYQAHQNFEQEIASPTKQTTAHAVRLTNLQPNQQYVFRVSGQPKVGPPVTSASLNFQTLAKTFGIDNHTVEMISDEAAIFRWTTTEESTSILQYAPYRNGTQAVEELREQRDDKTNFIHQMTVTNFEPGVQYAVTMMSVNANGQQASLTLNPFKTEANDAPPIISNIRIDSALSPGQKVRIQTIVAWQTNKPTTSQVQFRAGVQPDADTAWEESTLDPSFTKQHIAILTTLKPGAVYQLQVKNRDSIGQEVISQPVTFLTPQQQQSVFQVILSTVQRTFGWTQIFK